MLVLNRFPRFNILIQITWPRLNRTHKIRTGFTTEELLFLVECCGYTQQIGVSVASKQLVAKKAKWVSVISSRIYSTLGCAVVRDLPAQIIMGSLMWNHGFKGLPGSAIGGVIDDLLVVKCIQPKQTFQL